MFDTDYSGMRHCRKCGTIITGFTGGCHSELPPACWGVVHAMNGISSVQLSHEDSVEYENFDENFEYIEKLDTDQITITSKKLLEEKKGGGEETK